MAQLPSFDSVKKENILKAVLKDKFARCAFWVLVILYLSVFLAPFISPYSKEYSNRDKAYCPPSKIYVINQEGKLSLPYTYNYIRYFDKETFETKYVEDKTKKYRVKYFDKTFYNVEEGGELYLLGTDINGRDNFSRLLYGGQISLTIG